MNNLYIFILIPMIQVRLQWTSTYASSNCIVACVSLLVHKKGRKQLKASHPRVYLCSTFASELCFCFGLDAANDEAQIHPHSFCKRCYDAMQRKLKAVSQHRHFNSRMELYKWEAHASDGGCKVRSNVVVTVT